MPKRVHSLRTNEDVVQELVEDCKSLSVRIAGYGNQLRKPISEAARQQIHELMKNAKAEYNDSMQLLRETDNDEYIKTVRKLQEASKARVLAESQDASALAEQSKNYTKMDTFTDIVHVLSARLSELEDHVCIKVNGV